MKKFFLLSLFFIFCFAIFILAVDKVKEESTELLFDKIIRFSGEPGAPDVVCSGTGVRKKVVVKVYGAAVYIEPVEAKKIFGKYIPETAPEDIEDFIDGLIENNKFWNDFIGGAFHKVIVMRFVRDVGTDKITEAYKDAFKAYLKDTSDEAKKSSAEFLGFFKDDIKEGQDMTLRFAPDGTIYVDYAGKARGSIKNMNIMKALLTNWFGDDPVSDDIKEGGIKYIYDILK